MKSAQLRVSMIETLESMTLMSASAVEGTDAGEWINGDADDNTILARGGDDEIYAPLGDNVIDGGSGTDTVLVYGGQKADYSIDALSNGAFLLRGDDLNGNTAVNTLRSVERVIFDDGAVMLTPIEPATESNVAAQEFNAAPVEPDVPVNGFLERATEMFESREIEMFAFAEPEITPASVLAVEAVAPNTDFLSRVVELTNGIRRQNGLSDLSLNDQLQQAAQLHSEDMAYQDYFSHYGVDGSMPWDRGQSFGYDYRSYGENIAAGQRTPEAVVQAWVNSPSHLANILNPDYTEIGVGYVYLQNDTGDVNYNHYWTQDFGTQG